MAFVPARHPPRTLVLALTVAALAGCSETAPGAPGLLRVTPTFGADDVEVALTIQGEGFTPRAVTDFTRQGASRIDDTWQVRLGDTRCSDARRVDASTLVATVPPGLAPGPYDVTVTDPYGREVSLAQAYRVARRGVPASLAFPGPPLTLPAGVCSPPVQLETRDAFGAPALNLVATDVALAATPAVASFFRDATCATPLGTLSLPADAFGAALFFKAAQPGLLTITAGSAGLGTASETETILQPDGGAGGGSGGGAGGGSGGGAGGGSGGGAGGGSTDGGSYANAVLGTSGLIAYWRLNETSGPIAADSKGSLNGTYTNGVTLGAAGALTASGNVAASFDGVSQYVSLGDPAALKVPNPSVEAWVKTTDADGIVFRVRYYGYALRFVGGKAVFGYNDAAAVNHQVVSAASYNDDQWHHLVGTYDGNRVRLYVDTVAVTSGPSNQAVFYATGGVAIGRDGDADGSYLAGTIDEVAIYGRALGATEVQQHFNAR